MTERIVYLIMSALLFAVGSISIGSMYYDHENKKIFAIKEIEIVKANALANAPCMCQQKVEPKNSNVRRNKRK